MAFAEDEQTVQALGADGTHPALGIGVRVGRSKRRMDHVNAYGLKDGCMGSEHVGENRGKK
jgi:hypothetical protein